MTSLAYHIESIRRQALLAKTPQARAHVYCREVAKELAIRVRNEPNRIDHWFDLPNNISTSTDVRHVLKWFDTHKIVASSDEGFAKRYTILIITLPPIN